ncbi:MAG: hypothetical protein R3243_00600 [Arenibacter latericius]|nr:hypothetical protein [Arenibacter latericius]
MKKILFVAVLSLGSLTAFAQEGEGVTQEVATEVAVAQDDFTAIDIEASELPEAVSTALATDHPSATINKAYVNKEEQYKLEVALEDGTEATLYADKEGNWIELE